LYHWSKASRGGCHVEDAAPEPLLQVTTSGEMIFIFLHISDMAKHILVPPCAINKKKRKPASHLDIFTFILWAFILKFKGLLSSAAAGRVYSTRVSVYSSSLSFLPCLSILYAKKAPVEERDQKELRPI